MEVRADTGKVCLAIRAGGILIEYAGAGIGLVATTERRYPGLVSRIVPKRSKIERFDQILAVIKSKRVKLPRNATWLTDFRDEVMYFPEADTDDQCDAMSAYLNWAEENGPVEPGQAPSVGLPFVISHGRPFPLGRAMHRRRTEKWHWL